VASESSRAVLRPIRSLFTTGSVGGLADGELLERFVTTQGEAAELAFTALVERHGPMVLRVCRRVLHDAHDAEDAFQATFLILARKAGSIRGRESVAAWLHGVACNVAVTAWSAASKRRSHELRAGAVKPQSTGEDDRGWDDLNRVVHQELGRLPERYREAVVLCCLQGLTQQQAAHHLGLPLGTVQSRLARGRERLRGRLVRRGLAPSAGLLSAVLPAEAACGAVPAALGASTVGAATRFVAGELAAGAVSASVVALTRGVLRTMMLTKLMSLGLAGALVGAVVAGTGVLAQTGRPSQARSAGNPPEVKYELRMWTDGEPTGEPIIAEAPQGKAVQLRTVLGPVEIRPLAGGSNSEADRKSDPFDRRVDNYAHVPTRVQEAPRGRYIHSLTPPLQVEGESLDPLLQPLPPPLEVKGESVATNSVDAPKPNSDLDQRMTQVERKLDQILNTLEGVGNKPTASPGP